MSEKMRKSWERVPAVQMGSSNRELVERVVKRSKIAYQPVGISWIFIVQNDIIIRPPLLIVGKKAFERGT